MFIEMRHLIKKYGTTVVLITHNEAISEMADRVVRIHDGKIVENKPGFGKSVKEISL